MNWVVIGEVTACVVMLVASIVILILVMHEAIQEWRR